MKSIEIRTSQNVVIEYDLASLRDRGLALAIDWGVVVVGYGIIYILLKAILLDTKKLDLPEHVLVLILPTISFFIYTMSMEMYNFGQTIGKKALGIRIVRVDGKEPEWMDTLLRALLQLADSICCFGIIGAILIKTTEKGQRLGDMAAGTASVKIFSIRNVFNLQDILNIQRIGNYQPIYPQVRQLHERDMLFIKNALTRYQNYPNYAHRVMIEKLSEHLQTLLKITQKPTDTLEFLRTLLRDYIVLTR